MLVLTREVGQEVVIGGPNGIRVRVVEFRPGGRVRLGFTAPRSVPIHRSEVQDEIDAARDGKDLTHDVSAA
jgi:carbon storage regulator